MKQSLLAILAIGLSMPMLYGQETEKNPKDSTLPETYEWMKEFRDKRLSDLEAEKQRILDKEKYELKIALERIQKQLNTNEITAEEAKNLKEKLAEITADNIDRKTAIVENHIKLAEKYDYYQYKPQGGSTLELGFGNSNDDNGSFLLGMSYDNTNAPKYDKRTTGDVVVAGGWNNTLSSGHSLKSTPFKILTSGYAEFGYNLKTRLAKDSNFWRISYGISYQIHSFTLGRNDHMAIEGDETVIRPYAYDLKTQKFRINNWIVPMYLEFGPSDKVESYNKIRYNTLNHWKVGLGGYVGVNGNAAQFLNFKQDGRTIDIRERRDFNQSKFVYGLGGYVGVGPISLFAKYDLNPMFKNNPISERILSVGLRVEL